MSYQVDKKDLFKMYSQGKKIEMNYLMLIDDGFGGIQNFMNWSIEK